MAARPVIAGHSPNTMDSGSTEERLKQYGSGERERGGGRETRENAPLDEMQRAQIPDACAEGSTQEQLALALKVPRRGETGGVEAGDREQAERRPEQKARRRSLLRTDPIIQRLERNPVERCLGSGLAMRCAQAAWCLRHGQVHRRPIQTRAHAGHVDRRWNSEDEMEFPPRLESGVADDGRQQIRRSSVDLERKHEALRQHAGDTKREHSATALGYDPRLPDGLRVSSRQRAPEPVSEENRPNQANLGFVGHSLEVLRSEPTEDRPHIEDIQEPSVDRRHARGDPIDREFD